MSLLYIYTGIKLEPEAEQDLEQDLEQEEPKRNQSRAKWNKGLEQLEQEKASLFHPGRTQKPNKIKAFQPYWNNWNNWNKNSLK